MTSGLRMEVGMDKPFSGPIVKWEVPMSTPVRLCPADATVDDFRVDQKDRAMIFDKIRIVRVTKDEQGKVDLRLKVDPLPRPIACEAVIVQGSDQQPVGTALLKAGSPTHWVRVDNTSQKPRFVGRVKVELRPSQAAADDELTLGTYWGETIVIPDVVVDAPYVVPFNHDESLRPAVEKSLAATVTRSGEGKQHRFGVELDVRGSPVDLMYEVFARAGDREVRVTDWHGAANSVFESHTLLEEDPDPTAKTVDLILRPDRNWEIHSTNLIPPWGREVVLHDVPVRAK
jgi:hypothetical protein